MTPDILISQFYWLLIFAKIISLSPPFLFSFYHFKANLVNLVISPEYVMLHLVLGLFQQIGDKGKHDRATVSGSDYGCSLLCIATPKTTGPAVQGGVPWTPLNNTGLFQGLAS